MTSPPERPDDRVHRQMVLPVTPSSSVSSAVKPVPSQPRCGVSETTPSSSTSVTVTVTLKDPDRGVVSSSVAVTVTEYVVWMSSKLGGVAKYSWPRSETQKISLSAPLTDHVRVSRSGSVPA